MKKYLWILGNEIVLGTMIALLSVFTAVASYQGGMSDSEQNKFEILNVINQVVYSSAMEKQNIVDMSHLQSGMYLLKLYDGKSSIIKRFIKE